MWSEIHSSINLPCLDTCTFHAFTTKEKEQFPGGGDKNHLTAVLPDDPHQVQPADQWHLDVQEQEVRGQVGQGFQALQGLGIGAQNFDLGAETGQQALEQGQ